MQVNIDPSTYISTPFVPDILKISGYKILIDLDLTVCLEYLAIDHCLYYDPKRQVTIAMVMMAASKKILSDHNTIYFQLGYIESTAII